jgi:hypothetical protein
MSKINIIERRMTQNMERINREANWQRQKPKVKERGKGEDKSRKGKQGDRARNTDAIK